VRSGSRERKQKGKNESAVSKVNGTGGNRPVWPIPSGTDPAQYLIWPGSHPQTVPTNLGSQ
jgi:hypothetical protein